MTTVSTEIEKIDLSDGEVSVLNMAADYQLREALPTPLDHVILSRPQELADRLRETALSLVRKDCLELSGMEPRQQLHLTPKGLLLSRGTGAASGFAERLLAFFKRRLEVDGVSFRAFEWNDLVAAGVASDSDGWCLAIVVIQVLELYGDSATFTKGPPPQAKWGVPADIVYLRGIVDISGLFARAETRRLRRKAAENVVPSRETHPMEATMSQRRLDVRKQWQRLKTAVSGAAAVVDSEPKHLASVRPSVSRALELLAGEPSGDALDEVEYVLGRVEQFVSKWRPNPTPTPGVFYRQPPWSSNVDRETQEALRLVREIRSSGLEADSPEAAGKKAEKPMKIFVSHSAVDQAIAAAFVDLVRAAFLISSRDIRCTSVDGYKLPAGTDADEQLRREVYEAQVFVALLSPASIKSIYVIFELGARWGAKGHLIPVMVDGLDPSYLTPPLSALHAVSGKSEAEVHALLVTLGDKLGLEPERPDVYLKALKAFVNATKVP
jgi:hypothetical protein